MSAMTRKSKALGMIKLHADGGALTITSGWCLEIQIADKLDYWHVQFQSLDFSREVEEWGFKTQKARRKKGKFL